MGNPNTSLTPHLKSASTSLVCPEQPFPLLLEVIFRVVYLRGAAGKERIQVSEGNAAICYAQKKKRG